MAWALKHGHVILTNDLDFGTALALTRAQGPSVIQMRTTNVLPERAGPLLLDVIKQYESDLVAGALVVFAMANVRVRVLPF